VRNYIDENDKKNEIRLLFRHPFYKDKIIIVVEGQSDVRLFRSVLNNESIKLETIDGKGKLLSAMKDLVGEFPQRILAVCDADHDHLTGVSESLKQYSIYVTDQHDAEIMMLNSPALSSFVHEYSSFNNVDQLNSDLLEKAFDAALPIGLLRWINTEESLNIRFKGLNLNQFVDVDCINISIDIDVLVRELLKRSNNKADKVTKAYLIRKLSEYRDKNGCKTQVCCGHDLTNIIAMVYRQRWASLDMNMDHKKVESALRVGFQKSFFKTTALFKNLSNALTDVGVELQMC